MSTDSSAFSERSFEEEIHGQVFERDITRDRESCFRGGHAPRADTRGGTGLPQLGGHYGTAEPVRTSDFSIEFSCLERIANCIAPRLHFSTQLGTGRCRLTLLRSTIFLGSPFTERLTALLQNNIENTLVQENAGIEQQELNEKNSCKETQGGRADEFGNSEARPPGLPVTSEWGARRYRAALRQVRKALGSAAQHASRWRAQVDHAVKQFASTMQSLSKAFQTAKAKAAAKKAVENEKEIKDKHAGAGALGAGQQMMQAAADEEQKQKQEKKNEKQLQWERTKQEQTNYVENLISEMGRLEVDMEVGTVLKKNEELIFKHLAQGGLAMGKKNAPTAKGGSAIGLLPEKILALEGHYAAFTVKAMKYTEETWTKRISAAMRISQESRQLSFIITALNKDSLLSEATIMNFLATLGIPPSDPIIQSVAESKWNRSAQGAPVPQYRVTLNENVEWPLPFIQALSRGPNVALAGNDGGVEQAVWRITAGTKVTLKIDVAHLQLAGAMAKILNTVGTEKHVFEEAIADSLSAKWVEKGGARTEILGVHLEAARRDNSKNKFVFAALLWTDIGLPYKNGGPRLFATMENTEVAETMLKAPLTFTVVLGKDPTDCTLRFEASVVNGGAVKQSTDFGSGYNNALTRAQKAKDTGKKKALELLDDLIQNLKKDSGDSLGFDGKLESRDSSPFCNQLEIVGVCLKSLDRPELKDLHGELNNIKEFALSVANLATKGPRKMTQKKMVLGWEEVRARLTGARQRLLITLAAAPEVTVYQLTHFMSLKELLTALGKGGKWFEFSTEKLGSKLCTLFKHQGLPCVQVQPIFKNTAGNNMEEKLEWCVKSGALVEFEMTDNQVSLATQMTTQERKLFWEQQEKIIYYTSLIKEAADGRMRVDTFQEIVARESDDSFKGCFAKEELWLDNPKWDEMRANVLALGLLPCSIQKRGQKAAALSVKSKPKIQLTFASSNHSVTLVRSERIVEPKPDDVLQTERLNLLRTKLPEGIWVPKKTKDGSYATDTTLLGELDEVEDTEEFECDIRNIYHGHLEQSEAESLLHALQILIDSGAALPVLFSEDYSLFLAGNLVHAGKLRGADEEWKNTITIGSNVRESVKAALFTSLHLQLEKRLSCGLWEDGKHSNMATIQGIDDNDSQMTIDLEERDTWRKFAPTHPIADPQSELVDGFLAFLVNQNLADIYSKSGHLLLLRANSPWQVPVTKSSMSVGSEINTATLDLEEKEVKEFLRLLQEKNPSGVLRLSKRDGCEMSSCDAQWLEYDVPWMWALLEKIDHGFAAAGMAAVRIFHKLVETDVLKVLPDDQHVITLVGPRKALELHSRIGTEYLYTDLYDTLELNAIFDYEDWPSVSTMPDTLLDRAQAKKIKNRAIEALDKVAFLLVTRATGTGVRVQGSQAIKIQTGTDISLMSAEDFRMNIFHPMIVENMGLNMFSKAIAEVETITLEVGQNTGTTSVY